MFARAYNGIPIGITVEGSNILTRSLIVFGQGAMRSHPYLQDEVNAIGKGDVKAFDKAFFGHIRHFLGNAVRAFVLNLTRGHGSFTAHRSVAKHYRHLNRLAASFALLTDFGLLILGGSLKRKEYLSGRYADALAGLYMASTLLKQVHDKGYPASTRAITDLALQQTIYDTEQALLGVVRNLPNKPLALLARLLALPLGARLNKPKDKLIDKVADAVLQPAGGVREALCADIYIPDAREDGLGKLEATLLKVTAAEPVRRKITAAIKERKIKKSTPAAMTDAALMANVITAKEHKLVLDALAAQDDVVQVDYYTPAAYSKLR